MNQELTSLITSTLNQYITLLEKRIANLTIKVDALESRVRKLEQTNDI